MDYDPTSILVHARVAERRRKRILSAEERSANWLARGNELSERGSKSSAEKAYAKAEHWLTEANRLRGW